MSVVTTTEFTNYLSGMDVTDVQKQSAELVLAGVQSELERYLNRPLQQRRVMEEVTTDYDGMAYLAVTPIQEIYGIYAPDPATHERGEQIQQGALGRWGFKKGANWLRLGGCYGTYFIDYLGGMNADLDPGSKLAIMRVAAREFMHNHSDGMSLSNTEARPPADPTPVAKGWTDEELTKFDRLRRRVIL